MVSNLPNALFRLTALVLLVASCKTSVDTQPINSEKVIESFVFSNLTSSVNATIDTLIHTVRATVPPGTDLTKLTPTIRASSPASIAPASDVVQDFSKPVSYTVTAQNGTTQVYSVMVSVASSIVNANSLVCIGSGAGNLFAVDGGTATVKWRVSTGAAISASAYSAAGLVFIGSENGSIQAFDVQTGAQRWKVSSGKGVFSSPVTSGRLLYVGSEDQNLYALNVLTGDVAWKFGTAGGGVPPAQR